VSFVFEITEGDSDFEISVDTWDAAEEWIEYLDDLPDIDYEWAYLDA
jgi:hypothetical protein